ncbi:MAG: ABC transporter permease, partial [Proteobacteria bacterium]|nr:ABC transporter permease [Pseudomonadota bacterium]
MKNVWIISRRELAAYYESTIGYVYMVVFLMVSVGLYITPFFTLPRAEMRGFFTSLPLILCVFIPAVTMRFWAEDRKENTLELLLTFPMKPYELVLGKYFAGCIFYLITLAGTFTIPLMLLVLGDPDMGAIGAAYLGSLLLGGFFLSMGIFFSGLCKDQIVAFILALLACFGVYLLGTMFMATYLDSLWPGFGALLVDLVGVTGHFHAFARGVVEVGNVLYFLIWTVLFLFLNGFYLEGRNRPRYKMIFSSALILCLAIGLVFNYLTSVHSLGRLDFTEDRIYTLSPGTKKILSELKVPVQVKLYITSRDKMPTELKSLEQDILDKLEEMRIASGSKIMYRAIHMEAANVLASQEGGGIEKGESKEEGLEQRLLDKGIKPFSVRTLRQDQATTQLIYSSIGIAYKDKTEEIIARVLPRDLYDLEYSLINTTYKLAREKKPLIAMVAPE